MKNIGAIFLLVLTLNTIASNTPEITLVNSKIQETSNKFSAKPTFVIASTAPGSYKVMHYYGLQTYIDFPIHNTNFNITVKDGKVVNYHQKFIDTDAFSFVSKEFSLSLVQAMKLLAPRASINEQNLVYKGNGSYTLNDAQISEELISIKKIWFLREKKIIPAYQIAFLNLEHTHWYNTTIDANLGNVLLQEDWMVRCQATGFDHNHTASLPTVSESQNQLTADATGSYRVFKIPAESPNHGSHTLISDPSDSAASPFGWHDINGVPGAEFTITSGNNVYAKEDIAGNNGNGYSPNGGKSLNFNFAYTPNQGAQSLRDAAIVNLFYMNNVMHDVWSHYGFDEASGNFQKKNYSNQGLGNDQVIADAQDGSGTNNANFATPSEGTSPRMQMFLWTSTTGKNLQINTPSTIAGKYSTGGATFGPKLSQFPITKDIALLLDYSGSENQGCGTIKNSIDIQGKIALVRRGNCDFVVKVKNAQNAGAVAVIVYDNVSGDVLMTMGGLDATISIPSLFITQNSGNILINALKLGKVNATIYDSSSTTVTLDSDFDNGIISHEYGHGISNRLTGGAFASSCLVNQEQMGEGWSDFFSLVMTHRPTDQATTSRGIGTYVQNQPTSGAGIRPYPYSTDMSVSKYTYNDIRTLSIPHGIGSVWCSMLWDLYWALIEKYGYDPDLYSGTGGNNIAMQLVIDGLKLQPCNPGFVDGRDAILKADELSNNGENLETIWKVFARRGLGEDANQGSSDSRLDGQSGYKVPMIKKKLIDATMQVALLAFNDSNLVYNIKVSNLSPSEVSQIQIIDTLAPELTYLSTEGGDEAKLTNNILSITINELKIGEQKDIKIYTKVSTKEKGQLIFDDDMQTDHAFWKTSKEIGNIGWQKTTQKAQTGGKAWFSINESTQSDYSLITKHSVKDRKSPVALLNHQYNTEEAWDGGVIEINNGADWYDAKNSFIQGGYNSTISDNPESSLARRDAFTGNSNGYITSILDLKSLTTVDSFALKFRFAADGAMSGEGWYIDNFKILDAPLVKNSIWINHEREESVLNKSATSYILVKSILTINPSYFSETLLYPNPVQKYLEINHPGQFNIKIENATAQTVLENTGENHMVINLEQLSAGVYFVELTQESVSKRYKIIKQ